MIILKILGVVILIIAVAIGLWLLLGVIFDINVHINNGLRIAWNTILGWIPFVPRFPLVTGRG